MTEAYDTTTGRDSEPSAQQLTEQQLMDADVETTPVLGVPKITPVAFKDTALWPVDGPVIENPTSEDLKAIAKQYGELRRAAGGGEPDPITYAAPKAGQYRDALDAAQQKTLGTQTAMYESLIAQGHTADAALKAAQDYVRGSEPPKPVTDGKTDDFSTPRAAAERLAEVRRIEAETALKARTDAAKQYAHDATIGLTSEQISEQFKADKPAWVQTDQDIELWKATARQAGNLPLVAAIEKYQENFDFARQHEDREALHAERQQQAQPEPTPQPQQPQPLPPNVEQLRFQEANAAQILNNGIATFAAKYPNINQVTDQNIINQARQDAAALLFGKTYLDGLSAQRQIAEAQTAQHQARQYDTWGKQQDDLFQQSLSEADRVILPEVEKRAKDYLRGQGFSDDEMQRGWHETGQIRDWRAQKTVFDAIASKVRRADSEAKKQRAPVPSVQRPGVRGEQVTIDESRVAALSRALDNPGTSQRDQLRIAAQLLAAQRGKQRNSGPGWM